MNDKYVVDQDGTKIVKGSFTILSSGSESEEYLQQRALEEAQRLEEEANRPLSDDEVTRDYILDMDFRLIILELGM